jgi:hypothetical protein
MRLSYLSNMYACNGAASPDIINKNLTNENDQFAMLINDNDTHVVGDMYVIGLNFAHIYI